MDSVKKCDGEYCGGLTKPLSEFFNNNIKKDGKDSKCKFCRKQANLKWVSDNSEVYKKSRKDYYEKNYGTNREQRKIYYELNKDKILQQKKEYLRKDEIKEKRKSYMKNYNKLVKNKPINSKLNRQNIIEQTFEILGSICVLCGETNKHFLTVDHINDDGNLERHIGSIGVKQKILNNILESKERYQILCYNCNFGKYRLNPINHKIEKLITGHNLQCFVCLLEKDRSEFSNDLKKNRSCLSCQRFLDDIIKVKTFNYLGGRCVCCGITEPYKLNIDHINNDGWFRRRFNNESLGIDLYKKIFNNSLNKNDFQILCCNCNYSKYLNNGLCLHQIILKSEKIKRNKPKDVKLNKINIQQNQFEMKDVSIIEGINAFSKKLLNDYHYAGYGRNHVFVVSAVLNGIVISVAKFCTPVRLEVATSLGYEFKHVTELDRFCIHPEYQKKHFASWFMSRAIKKFNDKFPNIKALVSFADPRYGHSGTIYKAANWTEVGKTVKSYVYQDMENNEINKKTLFDYAKKRNMKEKECFEKLGLRKIVTPAKVKYIYKLK
jgi:hypothetical protein